MEERVKSLVSEVLSIEANQLLLNSNLTEELNMGSLELAELLINVEAEFNIHISDEEAQTLITIESLVTLIKKKSTP